MSVSELPANRLPVRTVAVDEPVIPGYACAWCPATFPSPAARDRHVEMNHEAPREADAALERIAAALERIAAALERDAS